MPSPTIEEYLETIYKLSEEGDVRPTRIAEALSVSGPTVTATLKRLAKQGYVTRPAGRVRLTKQGHAEAISMVRRHRIAERFLVDTLGLPWQDVHEEACVLEHALTPRIMEALERFLENPDVCPHGHPIPDADGTITEIKGKPLCDSSSGDRVEILRVAEHDDELLGYLASLGMLPGETVHVCDVAPFEGPLLIEVGGSRYALGRDVAEHIIVHDDTAAERPLASKRTRS